MLLLFGLLIQGAFRRVLAEGGSDSPDGTARPVTINFDSLPSSFPLPANQYQIASFTSVPGAIVKTAYDCNLGGSCPNGLVADRGSAYAPWNADLYINFAIPVSGLTFRILYSQANGFSATIDILVNNQLAFSGPFYGPRGGPGSVSPPIPMDFSNFQHVTGIRIRNVTNWDYWLTADYALFYDDFTFTPELSANITNSRIGGGQQGLDQTNQNALVGAKVALNTTTSQTGGTYSWSFTGPSYSIVSGCGSSSSCTIRPTNTGTITAKFTYTLDGVSVTPSVNINVVLPSLTTFWASESSDRVARDTCFGPPGVSYTLGCYRWEPDPPDGTIIHITAQIAAVSYLSDPSESGFKVLQAANVYRKIVDSGNFKCYTARTAQDAGWRRDFDDPFVGASDSRYPTAHYFSEGNVVNMTIFDPPGFQVANEYVSYDAAFVDDHFEDYVVYFTTDPINRDPSHPIFQQFLNLSGSGHPYASLAWSWGGQVLFNYSSTPSTLLYSLQSNTPTAPIYAAEADQTKSMAISAAGLAFQICTGTTATSNLIDGSRFYVTQLYWDFLNRNPDQGGLNFWRTQITLCGFDMNCIGGSDPLPAGKRVDVARAFFYSNDFIGLHPELGGQRGTHDYNWSFVYWCYRAFLRREPNGPPDNSWNGFNYWVGVLDSTNPDAGDYKYNQVIKAFITSTEYRGRDFCRDRPC